MSEHLRGTTRRATKVFGRNPTKPPKQHRVSAHQPLKSKPLPLYLEAGCERPPSTTDVMPLTTVVFVDPYR